MTVDFEGKYHIIMTEIARPPSPPRADEQEAVLAATVAARIFELRKAKSLSFDALSQKAGVAKGTLVQIGVGGSIPIALPETLLPESPLPETSLPESATPETPPPPG